MAHEQKRAQRRHLDAPNMLICTRFGLRVKDRAWLNHRLMLLSSITAPSLLAQDDQNFDWVVLIDDGLPADIRRELEAILRPFGDRAALDKRALHRSHNLVAKAESHPRLNESEYLLTARIDDDDAWSTDMVRAVRGEVANWLSQPDRAPGLSLSYQDGLEWIMYRMLEVGALLNRGKRIWHEAAIRQYRLPFIGMSVFVCSKFSDSATAMSGPHSRVAENLTATKDFATQIISTSSPMWLCCRHKQAGSAIKKTHGEQVTWTLSDLAAQFGIDPQRTQHYIDHADNYQYTMVKEPITKKFGLLADLRQIKAKIANPATSAEERAELLHKSEEITTELARLELNVLGTP